MGDPVCGPCRGVSLIPPFKRDGRGVVFLRGGRIPYISAILNDDTKPGNGRNDIIVGIPGARRCPQLVLGRNILFVVRGGRKLGTIGSSYIEVYQQVHDGVPNEYN